MAQNWATSLRAELEALVIPGSEEKGQDAAGQRGRSRLALCGFLEELKSGQSLPVHPSGLEDLG